MGMPIRYVAVPYPIETMTDELLSFLMKEVLLALTSPLDPEEEKIGLWKPSRPPKVGFDGSLDEMQDYFYDQGWTDGLPIIPPTEDRVAQMLEGTMHSPDEVFTKTMWPEDWVVTV